MLKQNLRETTSNVTTGARGPGSSRCSKLYFRGAVNQGPDTSVKLTSAWLVLKTGCQVLHSQQSPTLEEGISPGGSKDWFILLLPQLVPPFAGKFSAHTVVLALQPRRRPQHHPRTQGSRAVHRAPASWVAAGGCWLCSLHSFLKSALRGELKAPPTQATELPSSTSAEGFARCADEAGTWRSCSPANASPDHRAENDMGKAGLKSNQESEGVFMGSGAQGTGASWDWSP